MQLGPITPASSPLPFLSFLGNITLSPHAIAGWLFVIVLALWAIYTLIAIYHWVRFSHASLVAIPAIGVYLIVSAALIIFTGSALL